MFLFTILILISFLILLLLGVLIYLIYIWFTDLLLFPTTKPRSRTVPHNVFYQMLLINIQFHFKHFLNLLSLTINFNEISEYLLIITKRQQLKHFLKHSLRAVLFDFLYNPLLFMILLLFLLLWRQKDKQLRNKWWDSLQYLYTQIWLYHIRFIYRIIVVFVINKLLISLLIIFHFLLLLFVRLSHFIISVLLQLLYLIL